MTRRFVRQIKYSDTYGNTAETTETRGATKIKKKRNFVTCVYCRRGETRCSIYATSASHMVGQPVCARAITRTHTLSLINDQNRFEPLCAVGYHLHIRRGFPHAPENQSFDVLVLAAENLMAFDSSDSVLELYKFLKIEKKLVPIIQTIILCGRQELALSNDSGPIDLNVVEPVTMMSFSVLVDEITDVSRIEAIEQLTLCIRYLDSAETTDTINYVLREDFLLFVPVHSTTGQNLASVAFILGIFVGIFISKTYEGAHDPSSLPTAMIILWLNEHPPP
ncbi:zinc finger MYM-type protein 1-like [Aphis craccivora]|uniref:Zinc finger MYM-type protein 1-like n=1 Tax=Aphis craccivora TaxID=307492 RepID=A0A6G0Z8C2_APHCR|nr:zinc finger MYM-type protein 1-like [Aphis craccivora]